MTTLVAIQGDGWSVLGCDSRSSDESGRPIDMATHKIIENNGILIAGSGSGRGSNIMQFGWKAPKPTAAEDLDVYITQKFIPQMRQAFVDAGYDMKEDGDAAAHDSSIKALTKPESVEKAVRKAIQIAAQWDIYTAEPIITKIQYTK